MADTKGPRREISNLFNTKTGATTLVITTIGCDEEVIARYISTAGKDGHSHETIYGGRKLP